MSRLKKTVFIILVLIFVLIAIPYIIVSNTGGFYTPAPTSEIPPAEDNTVIKLYNKKNDTVTPMNINDYLVGVVAAEIPADFHEEAIKAQAVAARSYLLSHMKSGEKNSSHKGGDVCNDHTHCQAWISEEELENSKTPQECEKIKKAVLATSGQVMTYDKKVINAVFHSTSSGNTESAVSVWGSDIPYLQSVASGGDMQSPKYSSENEFTTDEFKKKAESALGNINWSAGLYSDIERSDAGGIISITVGDKKIKGTKFREIYSLRSTNVQLSADADSVKTKVLGYGHGVGMSQYGANYLANEGKSYIEILKTYYTGVEIEIINNA